MRFYDVNEGAILIDGHDVREFNRSELREMFGMVLLQKKEAEALLQVVFHL